MPTWWPNELASVFGASFEDVDSDAIDAVIAAQVEEGELLDFKADYVSHTTEAGWTEQQDLASDVASFANARGGVLVVGVTERNKKATARRPLATGTHEAKEQWIGQALRNHVTPLPAIHVRTVHADDGYFLLVAVPPSADAPHAVTGRRGDEKRCFWFPRRHIADTVWLTEHEVADIYRRRFLGLGERRADRERLVAQAREALVGSDRMWVWVAVIPDAPAPGALTRATRANIEDWWDGGLETPCGSHLGFGRPLPAPGRLTLTDHRGAGDSDELVPVVRYTEFHVDGTAFSAFALDWLDEEISSEPRRLTGLGIVDGLMPLVDATLRWCAHRAGSSGTATVVAALDSGATNRGVELVADGGTSRRRLSGSRPLPPPVDARTESAVDLSAVETTQQRLVVCHDVASGLLQHFGKVAPDQIHADGKIEPFAWGRSHYDVERWADRHDVSVESRGPS